MQLLRSLQQLLQELLTSHVLLRFPGCLGDTQFSFRFRQSVGRRALKLTEDVYNRDAPVSLQVRNLLMEAANTPPLMTSSLTFLLSQCPALSPQRELSHFFGYVYFRQVKDVSVKRGYFQKVSLTRPHLSPPVSSC